MWRAGFPPHGHFDDDGFPSAGATAPTGAFTRQYRSYPVSFIDRYDLERGDKIVLPPSALDSLSHLNIAYPMLFQIEARNGRKTHCGVQEFIAEEGHANLPYWLMQNLVVEEGEMIKIRNATLPKGTYVKFQPQSSDFLQIANPKAVLEATLRSFTCLTKGDSIAINYNDKTYHIDVLEVAPGEAISIVETDVNVDFAPALDAQKEEERQAAARAQRVQQERSAAAVKSDVGHVNAHDRLKQRLDRFTAPGRRAAPDDDDSSDEDDDDKPAPKPRFPGSGQALKASKGRKMLRSVLGEGDTSVNSTAAAQEKDDTNAEKKKPFQAFGGTGRSLRG